MTMAVPQACEELVREFLNKFVMNQYTRWIGDEANLDDLLVHPPTSVLCVDSLHVAKGQNHQ